MTNNIQIFNSPEFGQVRTIVENDKVLFCGSDVAKALGYDKPSNAVSTHCRYALKRGIPHPQGKGVLEMNFIPEGDMYRLIVRSKLPSAEKFERWVFDEVLPTIRKTGSYNLLNFNDPLEVAKLYIESETKRRELERINKEQKPKVEYFDNLVDHGNNLNLRDTWKVLKALEKKSIRYLLNKDILYRDSKGRLTPYADMIKKGYFTVKEFCNTGNETTGKQTLVTVKGREWLQKILPNELKAIKGVV